MTIATQVRKLELIVRVAERVWGTAGDVDMQAGVAR